MNKKKEAKLVNKVKHLLNRIGMPRWLHYFGPKTYEFYEHLVALLIRLYCKLSYRRIKKLLDLLGINCPSKSALQSTAKKIPKWLWDKAIAITSGIKHYIIAIDGTGFSRTNPSYHYLRRIDGKIPKKHVKLTAAFDTRKKKWCAAAVRILPSHDMKDAIKLIARSNPEKIVMDKAGDAEKLHKYCYENGIEAHIPLKNYGKAIHNMWGYRRKAAKKFRIRTYHRRELIESGNSSIKRKYGSSVSSKNCKTIRAEVMGKLLCHNLFGRIIEIQDRAYAIPNPKTQAPVWQ
ncbi:MAG: transposase [Nanoarchaeota archaeon]